MKRYLTPFLAALLLLLKPDPTRADRLQDQFKNPPPDARPHAIWTWMGCQITREGITRDLEQMAVGGIGGVVVFQLGDMTTGGVQPIANNPWASLKILSPEWWSMIGHAVSECHRLGLKFTLHNSPGWSGCGGPWITAELAAKKLVWTETKVSGPGDFTAALEQPESGKWNFYRDVAVLAVPAEGIITHERTRELTNKLQGSGTLAWTIPAGDANLLEIEVTNTWVNRMIGDEQEPDDAEWGNPTKGLNKPHRPVGSGLKAYPDWFVRNEARPSKGRYTFTTWKFWSKADPLLPAGLLGPVRVIVAAEIP